MKEILFDEPTLIDKLTEYIFFSNLFEWTQAVHSNAIVRSAGIPSVDRIDCNNFTRCTELLSCRLTCCTYIIQHELPSLSLHAPIASNCSKMKRNIRCFPINLLATSMRSNACMLVHITRLPSNSNYLSSTNIYRRVAHINFPCHFESKHKTSFKSC